MSRTLRRLPAQFPYRRLCIGDSFEKVETPVARRQRAFLPRSESACRSKQLPRRRSTTSERRLPRPRWQLVRRSAYAVSPRFEPSSPPCALMRHYSQGRSWAVDGIRSTFCYGSVVSAASNSSRPGENSAPECEILPFWPVAYERILASVNNGRSPMRRGAFHLKKACQSTSLPAMLKGPRSSTSASTCSRTILCSERLRWRSLLSNQQVGVDDPGRPAARLWRGE